MAFFNILKAILVRIMLLCHSLLTVWRVAFVYGEIYYLLTLCTIPFIIEGFYTVINRRGIEWKWICPCFMFYLLSTLPSIWLLEIDRTVRFGEINTTAVSDIEIIGVKIPISLEADTWVLVIEESLLYGMILGRWLLPRGKIKRGQLSELLFTFIGIASDIMELFELFDENPIRQSLILTYAILAVWSWSLFQFTMVLTVASRPIRINLIEENTKVMCIEPDNKGTSLEVLATFVSLFMQDGPFLALRLYTIITYNIINYSLLFFTTKNVLIILLLVYRMIASCSERCCPEKEEQISEKLKQKYLKEDTPPPSISKEDIIATLIREAHGARKRKTKQKLPQNGLQSNTKASTSDLSKNTVISEDLNDKDNSSTPKTVSFHEDSSVTGEDNDVQQLNTSDGSQIWIIDNDIPPYPPKITDSEANNLIEEMTAL